MYLGLDIATRTGAALWIPGTAAPRLLSISLPSDPECVDRPMETLREGLAALHNLDPITHMFFEATILPGKTTPATVYKLCALAGMAEWFAYRVKAQCRRVEQQSWRKRFIGRGTGKGDQLKRMAVETAHRLGWQPQDDHQAEAAGVLDYGLACFGVEVPWSDQALFSGRVAA